MFIFSLWQSYIQSFRDRQVDGRAYPVGGLMASGHTSVDMDYDCGSTVPLTAGVGPHVRVWPHSLIHK